MGDKQAVKEKEICLRIVSFFFSGLDFFDLLRASLVKARELLMPASLSALLPPLPPLLISPLPYSNPRR